MAVPAPVVERHKSLTSVPVKAPGITSVGLKIKEVAK